jgi:hypothetical protein
MYRRIAALLDRVVVIEGCSPPQRGGQVRPERWQTQESHQVVCAAALGALY